MDGLKIQRGKGIRNIGELSDVTGACRLFYSRGEFPSIFLDDNLRENFAALQKKRIDGADEVYLVHYYAPNDQKLKSTLRNIVDGIKKLKQNFTVFIIEAGSQSVIKGINDSFVKPEISKLSVKVTKKTEDNVVFAEKILYEAVKMGASDIHIVPNGKMSDIKFRVNKELFVYDTMSHAEAEMFGSVCYGHFVKGDGEGQEKGTGKGVYQAGNLLEGEFTRRIDDAFAKYRMVNIGHNHGNNFDLVMRVINRSKSNKPKQFYDLGFSTNSCRLLSKLDNLSRGMILTVGVTGSGKSTSQTNMMQNERDRSAGGRKIYSIEHPVEDVIHGVSQITAGEKRENSDQDFSFEHLNELFMRADPDSIAYGEIRNKETAEASLAGVESGHLVYGTMHASDCMGVFSRFESFGISRDKVCRKGFLRTILFQHLLPKLCPHCSIPYNKDKGVPQKYDEMFAIKHHLKASENKTTMKEVFSVQSEMNASGSLIRELQRKGHFSSLEVLAMREKISKMNDGISDDEFKERLDRIAANSLMSNDEINIRFRGNGCKHCSQGLSGVTPASEVLIPDDEFLSLVRGNQMERAEIHWKTSLNGRSATVDCYDKILSGIVDPRIVEEELEELGS